MELPIKTTRDQIFFLCLKHPCFDLKKQGRRIYRGFIAALIILVRFFKSESECVGNEEK